MSTQLTCANCGKPLPADARFCEKCGSPVSTIVTPSVVAPPALSAAPTQSNRPPWLIAGCVAIVALFVCVGIALAGGYFFFRPSASLLTTPTRIALGSPSTPALPASPATRAPTSAIAATTPTAIVTQTPACPPTPALPAGVLFSDDFASRQVSECNGWSFDSNENAARTWSTNKLTYSVKKKQQLSATDPDGEYDDFAAETQAQPVGNNYAEYGIAFRVTGKSDAPGSLYAFGISTDGNYLLYGWIAPNWVRPNPINATSSQYIKPGVAPNTIGVIVQGSTISLYINRVLVKTITDNSITGKGRVGVFARTGVDNDTTAVAFSQLTILTPDKARADWGGSSVSSAPPVVASSPPSPSVPPTLAARPGLYVTAVRLDPGPKRGADITFYPKFLNTTNGTQTYRAKVYIYSSENLGKSTGETSAGNITIPVGTTEQQIAGSWKSGVGGCQDFVIRVGWLDQDNRITFFNKPDGNIFEYLTPICP